MRRHAALLGARPPPLLWFLFPFLILMILPNYCQSMKFDAERIAARLKIDDKWDQLEAFESQKSRLRKGRQIQPKEISIQVTAPLFSSRLFDYGTQAGDAELPQALDVGKKLDLVNPIAFFGGEYKTVYILSNGAVGFEAGSRSYKSGVLPGSTRLLAPFWNRNDLRNGGKVYYREVTKGRVLERGQSEIRYQYDKSVKVKSALIITWDKMQPLNTAALPEENTNTFQAAIFITANGTFANFIYSNVGWTQGAEAGFNAGDATNHFKLPTSGTPNIMYLEEYGNTGIPGEWMFELSDLRVISCKSGIKGDTCDQECTNGEWGPDCAYCCHCSEGTCHPITGDCGRGCATCWDGPACQTRQDKCATRTQCASNALSFNDYDRCGEPIQRCQCLNGYKGDGYINCEDVNECTANSTICHRDATCTNTPGRFFCQCKDGFSGDGQAECSQSFLYQYDNHKQLARRKNSKMEWKLKQPMKIFGEIVDKVTVTSTGLVAIDEIHHDNSEKLEEMQLVGIAPFFAPFDISKTGSISVEEVNDSDVLRRLTRTIAENYNDPSFNAKNALIATFSNVTDGRQVKGNTFQTLLIDGSGSKGEKMSFAQIMYRDLPMANGEAGVLSRDSSSSILLPASGTEGISQLAKLSNIKQPGTWLFRIDRPQLTPCAQAIQVPPYCDHLLNNVTPTSPSKPRLPSKLLEEKKEDLTLPKPGAFLIDQQPEVIRPTFTKPNNQQSNNKNDRNILTVTTGPVTNQQNRPAAKTTQRPRPNFSSSSGSTPHRPIVSLSDEDFEIGPDAFEVTFPPFVTVVPELFRPKPKEFPGRLSTQRPLPDFSIKTPLKETTDPEISTTRRIITSSGTTKTPQNQDQEDMSEDEESPFENKPFDGESERLTDEFDAIKHAIDQKYQNQKPQESKEKLGEAKVVEATEEPSTSTTTTLPITTTTMQTTTQEPTQSVPMTKETEQPSIFVFTTQKPSTNSRRITQKTIVTAPIPVQKHHPVHSSNNNNNNNINLNNHNDNDLNTNSIEQTHTEEQSERKLAIILPVMIILAWMAILVCIAGIVCCKRRSSRESSQLRAMYGAAYGIRPTSFEAKRKETSYEDHLERAARLGGGGTQPTLSTQQAGKISLYGSYWNLQPLQSGHSPAARLSTQERQSPPTNFINNGYTNPTRFTYAGHY